MSIVLEASPPLSAGDRLSREEFLIRWENEPRIKRAELIGGVVYMPSPVSLEHGEMEANVGCWLGVYQSQTPGVRAASNATTFLLDDAAQPDLHLRLLPEYGGESWVEKNFLHGAPEFVVEICKTSAAYDLNQKLDLYLEAGVREYLAVLLYEREIRWHILEENSYRELHPENGVWRSRVFPGLWLNGPALLAMQMDKVLATLQDGLASDEHVEFARRLASRLAKET